MTKWQLAILTLRHRGETLQGIAQHCGVSYSTILRLELGIHNEPKHALGECILKFVAETQKGVGV